MVKPFMQIKQITPEAPGFGSSQDLLETADEMLVDHAALDCVHISGASGVPVVARAMSIEQSLVESAVLAGSTLAGIRLLDCHVRRADLTGATWVDARLVRTKLGESKLTGFDARGGELRDVVFNNCKMPESFFIESSLTRVRFDECQISGIDLSGAKLHSVSMRGCDARNLRLIGARIDYLDLRGSMIEGITIEPEAVSGIVIEPIQAPALAVAMGARIAEIDH